MIATRTLRPSRGSISLLTRPRRSARSLPAMVMLTGRSIWGLDVRSLDAAGTWTLRFEIDGPQGPGTGDLTIDVLKQPGPPLPLSWAIGLIPLGLAVAFYVAVWVRTGPPSKQR